MNLSCFWKKIQKSVSLAMQEMYECFWMGKTFEIEMMSAPHFVLELESYFEKGLEHGSEFGMTVPSVAWLEYLPVTLKQHLFSKINTGYL